MGYRLQEWRNLSQIEELYTEQVSQIFFVMFFSHLVGQLAEAHIVSWFELGRVQLDLLSQLDQAWWGSQTAL